MVFCDRRHGNIRRGDMLIFFLCEACLNHDIINVSLDLGFLSIIVYVSLLSTSNIQSTMTQLHQRGQNGRNITSFDMNHHFSVCKDEFMASVTRFLKDV